MVKAHLVNHTHWDREWYFTTMDAQVLSEQLFTEVLDELENNPAANFCLDGQVSIVDEYVALHPENMKRIQQLVKAGRLFIGPWYTQTDALLPDTESIIRNLVLGMLATKRQYGEPMKIGYLPDTFGFNAQMPTIFHQVGIDNMIFWRGTNFEKQTDSVYFRWHGLGNREILAINFPFGYFTGQITPESKNNIQDFVQQRYDPAVKFEAEHGGHQDVLMPSGIDQMNIVKNMTETIALLNTHSQYETVVDTYPNFVNIIRAKKATLPLYEGELRLPTYARVHRSIGSVRHQIKQRNYFLEQKILKRIEPLTVIAHQVGIDVGNGLLIKLWHKVLECQAHDTLGGSISDNVAVDALHRFKEANELADGIENLIKKKIADHLSLNDQQVLVFNTDVHEYIGRKMVDVVVPNKHIRLTHFEHQEIVTERFYPERQHIMMMTAKGQEFTDEPAYYRLKIAGDVQLPAMSYQVITIMAATTELLQITAASDDTSTKVVSGDYELAYQDGQLNLTVAGQVYENVLSLVDSANDGDTYDYSPLVGDLEQVLSFTDANVHHSIHHDILKVYGMAKLPITLEDRYSENGQCKTVNYEIQLRFNDDHQIMAHLIIDNTVESHRMRLRFNTGMHSEYVVAQIQAGYTKTINEPITNGWQNEYVEKPVNLYNFDKTVSLTEKQRHFTFWGAGEKEYERDNEYLYITLMATTGELGKPNLAWRPGRASGDTTSQGHIMMPTPLAQEMGMNQFDFAFTIQNKAFNESENNQITNRWLTQDVSYQNQHLNVFINRLDNKIWQTENNPTIPKQVSVITMPENIAVSAIYPAYTDDNCYIVRIQNLTSNEQQIPEHLLQMGEIVDALEQIDNQRSVQPYDLISIKIPYNK